MRTFRALVTTLLLAALVIPAVAQQQGPQPAEIVITPTELRLEVGGKATVSAVVKDADGNVLEGVPVLFFSTSRRALGVTPAGEGEPYRAEVEAYRAGEFAIMARVPTDPADTGRRGEARVQAEIAVVVPAPPITRIELVGTPPRFYVGTNFRPDVAVTDRTGATRDDVMVTFASSNPAVAEVSTLGRIKLVSIGETTITASAESASVRLPVRVEENPTATIEMQPAMLKARTGDVIHMNARALDAGGNEVEGIPIQYSFQARTVEHALGQSPSGLITEDGRFVADVAGEYVIIANAGERSSMTTLEIEPRNVRREIELVGHGAVRDRHTSDLWVWEGADGRDYAITGTWGAEGHAYFWDVTDPSNMKVVDTVLVDARTVNDVKVSEDGRIAVISREGASNRRNGLVILDVSDMQSGGARILATFDDQLTGGVHNLYIAENHIYALSAGQRYDVINIEDPTNPYRVGRYAHDSPGTSIHDVWVANGIAFSSNWSDGVVAVDVGGGGQGGSPNNPVFLGSYAYPSGWNHAAYPYWSESAGKFYMFAGDEAGRRGNTPGYEGEAERMNGWIHVIEWDEWGEPHEVARYEVPEVGTHNLWVEDDIMYVAYYQGGLRVVDVSGELLGDLYRQGREIGYFLAYDPLGYVKNSPFAWGPQPFKGNIFFSDHNSGLWAVRIAEEEEEGR
ncbi:MAG TPA: hypothetical protein VGD06_15395 [Acidobacteriota bacterium]